MSSRLSSAAVIGSLALVFFTGFARAEPGALDFNLPGASSLDLRPASLYADEVTPIPTVTGGVAASGLGLLPALGPMALGAEEAGRGSSSYIAVRGGPLFFLGDLEDLGTGFMIEGAFGFQPLRFLAIEIQSGYFMGEDSNGTLEAELWGIPIVGNVKLCIPIFFLQLYGGLGAGGYYVRAEADSGVLDDNKDDFVFGGSAFVGADIELGPVFAGVEGKYIVTTDIDAPGDGNFTLEGFAVMAVVGFRL